MRKAIRIGGIYLMAALLFIPGILAQPGTAAEETLPPADEAANWRLEADHFSYDARQGVYRAWGQVSLRSQDRLLRADRIRLDGISLQAILEGRVRIEQGEDWLEGERAFLDLDEQRGNIEHGRGFLAENNFHFSGALIEKLGPQTYRVEEGRFTTCDGERPSWHFRASDLRVTVEGYSLSKHNWFYVRSLPVLYSPYLVFPAKRERQSGFLFPRFSSGELLGDDVDLPFFWAISESADATFYGHYMSKRGLMSGAEFRYAASETGAGVLRFDYLDDQEDTEDLADQEFRAGGSGFSGEYRKRWWWRSKQDFALPYGAYGKLDLDFISDADYLREFKTGFSTWEESDKIFRNTFGRGLINDESVTTRESNLLLNKTWAAHSLDAELHYFQNLNNDLDETTLQQLPLVAFTASRQPLLEGPFFYQANAAYVDYWRREGTRGHRLNLNPRVSLPLRGRGYLELEPFVGILETAYLIDDYDEPEDSPVSEKTFQSREIFETGVQASTELVRIFGSGTGEWTKTKHGIRPEIVYEYRPEVAQEKFPLFDSTDRISSRNRVNYSLTNYFVARLDRGPEEVDYQRFCRIKFSQFYDITEPKEGLDTVTNQRAFSNVSTQVDLTPKRYVNLTYKNEWSPYDGDFKRHELFARLWDQRGDEAVINYSRQLDEGGGTLLDEIDAKLTVNFWGGLSFDFRTIYSFDRKENLETDYLVSINRQCWGISLGYVDQPDNKRFLLGVSLYGVGELRPQGI